MKGLDWEGMQGFQRAGGSTIGNDVLQQKSKRFCAFPMISFSDCRRQLQVGTMVQESKQWIWTYFSIQLNFVDPWSTVDDAATERPLTK